MTDFNVDAMGKSTQENQVVLDAQAGIKYAKATNDPTPSHLDGTFIPPIYAVVPVWEKVFEVVAGVVPEEHFFSVVHGEQDMIFRSPLKAGMTLRSHAIGESISVKESGTTLVIKSVSVDDLSGDVVVEQYFTMFFRGVQGGDDYGTKRSSGLNSAKYGEIVASGSPVASQDAHIDNDQTLRYADASGDRMPIHLDPEFARSVGLPGIIVHGLCTMAIASWAAIGHLCDEDPAKLSRIAVRFSKPLLPGDDLQTSFFEANDAVESVGNDKSYSFIAMRPSDQTPILTNAFVQVRG